MIKTVRGRLDDIREKTMLFLRAFPKKDAQIQAFLAEPDYKDDPVGKQWTQVNLVSGTFLQEFHAKEAALDASEAAILGDSHYTPSIVMAPVVEASQWAMRYGTLTQERQNSVDGVLRSIAAAPVHKAGDLWAYMDKRPDGRPSTDDKALVTDIAARRKLFVRHSYAFTFDRPANRFNWAMTDILEPYLSYDYWWRWATDAAWYQGSDLRLDPDKFPKDAAATRKLWREFCSVVDAEERLNATCIKAALKDSSAEFRDKDSSVPKLSASRVREYWTTFFLPDDVAREVGYRRPATPDVETARLLNEVPDAVESPASLRLPWSPDPYVMPRVWRWSVDNRDGKP